MSNYVYSVSQDTAAGLVLAQKLGHEIRKSRGLFCKLNTVSVDGDVLTVATSAELTGEEETLLDSKIAAHVGVPSFKFIASLLIVDKNTVNIGADWEDLDGVVTTPGAFLDSADEGAGKTIMNIKTNGTGCQIRGIYRPADGETFTVLGATHDLPDTENAWQFFDTLDFNYSFPLGTVELSVQARKQSATSFQIKHCSMTLLRKS